MWRHLLQWFADRPMVVFSARCAVMTYGEVVLPDDSKVVRHAMPTDSPSHQMDWARTERRSA